MVPVVGQHDSSTHCCRDSRAIPARWNHFADRGVLGGESRRKRRGPEEVDMSRTVVDAVDLERRVWGCSDGWRRTCPQAMSRR